MCLYIVFIYHWSELVTIVSFILNELIYIPYITFFNALTKCHLSCSIFKKFIGIQPRAYNKGMEYSVNFIPTQHIKNVHNRIEGVQTSHWQRYFLWSKSMIQLPSGNILHCRTAALPNRWAFPSCCNVHKYLVNVKGQRMWIQFYMLSSLLW